jgi:TM2 domain-containing membrane protein YozV
MSEQPPYDPSQQPPPPPPYGAPPAGYAAPPPGSYGGPSAYPPDASAPYGRDQYGRPMSDKSKVIAALLQFFVGWCGAGRWYTGHTGMALAQLFTCGGLGIWALIDAILLLVKNDWTDARGLYLRP